MDSFAKFSTGALAKANDGLVHFMRTMSGGGVGSGTLSEFMDYVRQDGPQVGETLGNLGRALVHLVTAASEAGAGLLTVVNAVSRLVSALPTSLLSSLLQFALVMKTANRFTSTCSRRAPCIVSVPKDRSSRSPATAMAHCESPASAARRHGRWRPTTSSGSSWTVESSSSSKYAREIGPGPSDLGIMPTMGH